MADNYEVKRYSRFWWGIIDPETKLYVKGEVGPYGLALFKTRQEAENKIAELEEPEPIDEVWTNGSGPGYYETIDYIRRDLENAGISFKEYDDGNFTIFAVKNLVAQEADEIIFNWINDYERKEGKSETSFRISNDFLFENKESNLEEGYKLVKSNKTIDELKSLVDNLFNELKKLEKPEEYTTGGEYYGRTQLLRSHSNVLELVTNYTHTKRDSYDFNKSWSDGTYCIKIGGAYKYSDYKNLLKPLLDAFNYKVVSGFGISEDLLIDDTICSLIDDYGTNYSVYGIGFDKNLGNRKVEESLNEHRDDNLVWKIWLPKLGEYLNDGLDDIEFESKQDAWDYIYEELWEGTDFDSSIDDEYYKQFEGAEPTCSNLDKYMTRKWDMNNESLEEAMKPYADDFEEFFWGVYDNEYDLPFNHTIKYIDDKYADKIWVETEEDPNPDGQPLNLSKEEQIDIFKHARDEARYWDNLDIYNSHARYKSVAAINNQLKHIFGITNNVLHEQLKETVEEKEFDATFHDGPNSDRQERVIIKAKDLDDAVEKAYRMPQAKRYDNVIVGERTTGLTSYIVAFYANMVFNGKVENRVSEERLVFNAENEAQAKAAYNKKYLGKYYRWLYPSKENVLLEPPTDIQGGKYGRVFDVYQFGSEPSKNADDAKEILNEFKK